MNVLYTDWTVWKVSFNSQFKHEMKIEEIVNFDFSLNIKY